MKTTFSLATSDRYKNANGEKVEDTQWHNVVAWGKAAKIAEDYLEKGAEVCISGKLTTRPYEDSEGNKKYISEIVMQDLLMLGSKN